MESGWKALEVEERYSQHLGGEEHGEPCKGDSCPVVRSRRSVDDKTGMMVMEIERTILTGETIRTKTFMLLSTTNDRGGTVRVPALMLERDTPHSSYVVTERATQSRVNKNATLSWQERGPRRPGRAALDHRIPRMKPHSRISACVF